MSKVKSRMEKGEVVVSYYRVVLSPLRSKGQWGVD